MKKEKGFTLVELLAAIVILGVLMAVAAGAFGSIKKNNAKKELEQVATSIKKIGETMYTSSIIKGEDLFVGGNSVVFTGTELKGKELIESATIENPYDKNKTCNIRLTLTKIDGKTTSQGCIICDSSKPIPDNETSLNICK